MDTYTDYLRGRVTDLEAQVEREIRRYDAVVAMLAQAHQDASIPRNRDCEHSARLDAEHAAAKAGAEAGELRVQLVEALARIAELEAALDVEPCADCGSDCQDCDAP